MKLSSDFADWLKLHNVEYVADVLDILPQDAKEPQAILQADRDYAKIYWESTDRTHYLEIDIYSKSQLDWFYRNRMTGQYDGTDAEFDTELPERFFTLLKEFS